MKTAYYVRVFTVDQKTDSQLPGRQTHSKQHPDHKFLSENYTGRKMDQLDFNRLMVGVRNATEPKGAQLFLE